MSGNARGVPFAGAAAPTPRAGRRNSGSELTSSSASDRNRDRNRSAEAQASDELAPSVGNSFNVTFGESVKVTVKTVSRVTVKARAVFGVF